jgi:cytochrome c-type biogenesis protein CcmH
VGWVLFFFMSVAIGAPIEDLARKIERQVVSPCCFNQTVDLHRSGAAAEVRADIHRLLGEGLGEEAVLKALVHKHGRKVLAVPKAEGFNASVWWMPVVAVGVGAVGLRSYLSRTSKADGRKEEALSPSDRERLEALLKLDA